MRTTALFIPHQIKRSSASGFLGIHCVIPNRFVLPIGGGYDPEVYRASQVLEKQLQIMVAVRPDDVSFVVKTGRHEVPPSHRPLLPGEEAYETHYRVYRASFGTDAAGRAVLTREDPETEPNTQNEMLVLLRVELPIEADAVTYIEGETACVIKTAGTLRSDTRTESPVRMLEMLAVFRPALGAESSISVEWTIPDQRHAHRIVYLGRAEGIYAFRVVAETALAGNCIGPAPPPEEAIVRLLPEPLPVLASDSSATP